MICQTLSVATSVLGKGDPRIGQIAARKTMTPLWQDLRYGTRMLVKQARLAPLAVLSLALGIGANTED